MKLTLDWFRNRFIPSLPQARPVLLILDGYNSHIQYEILKLAKEHQIEIAKLPHTSLATIGSVAF